MSKNSKTCNSRLKDDATSCIGCGSTVQTMPEAPIEGCQTVFSKNWREVFGSPVFLAVTVIYTVSFLMACMQVFNPPELLADFVKSIRLQFPADAQNFIFILFITPWIEIGAGLWILYAENRKTEDQPVKTMGLSLIWIGQIFILAVSCLALIGILVVVCLFFRPISQYLGLHATIPSFLCLWGIASVVLVVPQLCMLKVLYHAKKITVSTSCILPMAVFCIILAGIYLITAFATEVTYQSLLSGTQYILFSIVLLKYLDVIEAAKEKFENQEYPYLQTDSNRYSEEEKNDL